MSSLYSTHILLELSQFKVFPSSILQIEGLYYGTDVGQREYQQVI